MARIVETLTPLLISINARYKAHAGHPDHGTSRGRPLGLEPSVAGSGIERCVVLAGGTGGAKLAAGMQELLGAGLSVVANTARRHRDRSAWTSPPTPTWSPTG